MKKLPKLDTLPMSGRPREIHTHPCALCPSICSTDDPESIDIRDRASHAEKIESVFRCGWRSEKACKGYVDFIGVTAEDLR